MAKGVKVGVGGVVRNVKDIKQGVGGVVRSINSGFVGVSGANKRYWGNKVLDRAEITYTGIWGETYKPDSSVSVGWSLDTEKLITQSETSDYGTCVLYSDGGGYINTSKYAKGILANYRLYLYFKGDSKAYEPYELIKLNDSETTRFFTQANYTVYFSSPGSVQWLLWPWFCGAAGSVSSGSHSIGIDENSIIYSEQNYNAFGIVKATNDTSSTVDIGWSFSDITYNGVTVKPKLVSVPSGWTLPT